MKRLLAIVVLLGAAAGLGAWASEPSERREVRLERGERMNVQELNRRSVELDDAARKLAAAQHAWQQDIAAIVSEIRSHHQLAPDDEILALDAEKGVIVVGQKAQVAPQGSK